MWPTSQASKMLINLLFNKFIIILIYCIAMDILFFIRIRSYKLDIFENHTANSSSTHTTSETEYVTWIPCTYNSLCYPTVKALMIDPINHYIYGPLCSLMDLSLNISKGMLYLTPNMISYSHVIIAIIAGNLFTRQSLSARKIAVVLFQIRMILDDLDGHVARERKNIKGERSEVGTLGYWVDGLCDMVGVVAMIIGLLIYLRNNPPRRKYNAGNLPYHHLKELSSTEDIEKEIQDVGVSYKTKMSLRQIVQVLALFTGQMLLSSLMWNRYIDVYQEILENSSGNSWKRQTVFRSWCFFTATSIWRYMNPHCYLHLLSIAVYLDKTWCCLRMVHQCGYLGLIFAAAASEYLLADFRIFIISSDKSL